MAAAIATAWAPAARAQPPPRSAPPDPARPQPRASEPSSGQTPDDLSELEEAAAADQAERDESKPEPSGPGALSSLNPDISFLADVAAAWFSSDEPLQGGAHDPQATGFVLQQLEMAVSSPVDPYFRFDANVVFSEFGVEIEEVTATSLHLPANLQLRAGQFLTRFGRINPTHPHSWDFVDQPFALGRVFGGEGNRGVGAELSWLVPVDRFIEVVGSVTDAAGEEAARSFFGGGESEVETPLDFQSTLAVKQFFELGADLSVLWGLSAATGPNSTGHRNRTDVFGTDLYVKFRPITYGSYTILSLQSEWLVRRRQVPDDLLTDITGYAQGFWRLDRRWGAAARYEYGSPAYDSDGDVAPDDLDPDWTDHRHRVALAATFWPTEFSRVRLQGQADAPTWEDDPIWGAILAFEFTVGPHGAHVF
ncbi:MAG TPA: zinc-regulated TonB-dependent outer membrane receptor [Kofleriaceae bacterium]|nr:zinc-regulated TonB-dependent outer membrane receptor [Kofleriaceae bacterium]